MKKFLACLIITGAFAIFVFSLGWTQIKVKPGKIGVVVSKTQGISEQLVIPGKFSWHKEFLLPTNAQLKIFEINPVNVTKTVSGQLPSGDLYTSIFGSKNNFQYSITYSFSLTMNEEELLNLLKQKKVTSQENLNEYLDKAADTIAQLATEYILRRSQENPNFRVESIRRDDLSKNIQSYKECPDVELSVFAITEAILPDYNLYKHVQENVLYNTGVNYTNQAFKSENTDALDSSESEEVEADL